MPLWTVKICDPEGKRHKDECHGPFASMENASAWAQEHVPGHITWHIHHLKPASMYDRAVWEAKMPDWIDAIRNP